MKAIIKNHVLGALSLASSASGVLCSIDTANIKNTNVDNCVIYLEGVIIGATNTGLITVTKGQAAFKKISGTITQPSGFASILYEFEEIVNFLSFNFSISGSIINLNVTNNSGNQTTVEGFIDLECALFSGSYVDNRYIFP